MLNFRYTMRVPDLSEVSTVARAFTACPTSATSTLQDVATAPMNQNSVAAELGMPAPYHARGTGSFRDLDAMLTKDAADLSVGPARVASLDQEPMRRQRRELA